MSDVDFTHLDNRRYMAVPLHVACVAAKSKTTDDTIIAALDALENAPLSKYDHSHDDSDNDLFFGYDDKYGVNWVDATWIVQGKSLGTLDIIDLLYTDMTDDIQYIAINIKTLVDDLAYSDTMQDARIVQPTNKDSVTVDSIDLNNIKTWR